MMDLSQRAAYLRGLAEGKGLTKHPEHGDFIVAVLDCLNEMAEEIETLEEYVHDLAEYAEAIDEDMGDIEDLLFDEVDDEDEDDFCGCGHHDDDGYIETICPVCHETIGYYDNIYDEPVEIVCPNCDTVVATIGDDEYEDEDALVSDREEDEKE